MLNTRLANTSDEEAWDAVIEQFAGASPYCLFAWKKTVERAYGFSCPYLLAEDDKSTILGVLPLVHLKPPFRQGRLVSLPYCDAGGVWAENPEAIKGLLAKASALARELQVNNIELRLPTRPEDHGDLTPLTTNKVRMLLPLPENAEVLMTGFKAKLRSQIKKPIKDGLTCQVGGGELLDRFYNVFQEGMRDLGSPPHSKKWFDQIVSNFGKKSRIGVVSMPNGEPAAAGVILCCGNSVTIPWAASLRRHNHFNPNMLLYWNFLSFATESGYRLFDFGRSTPSEGTYRFKEQWGATPAPLFWATMKETAEELPPGRPSRLSAVLRPLLENLFQRLPIPISNLVGSRMRRYISL